MIAGFFSPMPPARTGVADYSAALIKAMRRQGQIRIGRDGDVNLYHLGNNPLHHDAYQRAITRPGVVVIHDAVLHHFLLGSLTRDQYLAEFVYNYGAWNVDLASRLWVGRARSGIDPAYFRYPMLKRAVDGARSVIVHNSAARRIAADHGALRVTEIPHLFDLPPVPPAVEVVRLRQSLGVGPRAFLFGVFGHLRESKRLTSVLRAFENVIASGTDAALLVAGDFVSPHLARALEPERWSKRIVRVGFTPERNFWLHASAVDACVNLRYPSAGETSGIAIRLMGIGKPVLMTAGEEADSFPDSACLRVDPGASEVDMLTDLMIWLARSPAAARDIGARASAHIGRLHNPERVAASYWSVLESVA